VAGTVFVRWGSARREPEPLLEGAEKAPLCGVIPEAILAEPLVTTRWQMEGRALLYTPQRLFGEIGSSPNTLTHEPFLERARLQREQEREGSARLALGAYVVARLVDKLLTLENDDEQLEGFRWQLEAVRGHVSELAGDAPETAQLTGVVAAVPAVGMPTSGLWMSLTAYAYFLEHEGRLEEALEMLALAARAQGTQTAPTDFTTYALFAGRLNRLLARWEAANACYRAAEESALSVSDLNAALRSRLGRANALRGQGNLPLARLTVEQIIKDAGDHNFADVQSDAFLDLGAVLVRQGLDFEALQAVYQAFVRSLDCMQQMRILGDLGVKLRKLGALDAARLAFEIVGASNTSFHVRTNALLELMELESAIGNRLAFERLRQEAAVNVDRMSPSTAIDYRYKLGIGLMRFHQVERAHEFLTEALHLSEQHRLNEWYFRVKCALDELDGNEDKQEASASAEVSTTPTVQHMAAHLREYALATGV
jgi:tetratricopeptide (TPR) repeat protein